MASLTTPQAILIGFTVAGGLAGVGLYMGLRARPIVEAAQPSAPAPASITITSGAAAPPALPTADAPSAPASPSTAQAGVARGGSAFRELSAAFESQRARIVAKCWDPIASQPGPPSTVMTFAVLYGPDGHQMARGMKDDPRQLRPGVSQCVDKAFPPPVLTPPGAQTRMELKVTLP